MALLEFSTYSVRESHQTADAVHPENKSRPAHGWFLMDDRPVADEHPECLEPRGNVAGPYVRLVNQRRDDTGAVQTQRRHITLVPHSSHVHWNARYHPNARMLKPWLEHRKFRLKLYLLLPQRAAHETNRASVGCHAPTHDA